MGYKMIPTVKSGPKSTMIKTLISLPSQKAELAARPMKNKLLPQKKCIHNLTICSNLVLLSRSQIHINIDIFVFQNSDLTSA